MSSRRMLNKYTVHGTGNSPNQNCAEKFKKNTKIQDKQSGKYGFSLCSRQTPIILQPGRSTSLTYSLAVTLDSTGMQWQLVLQRTWTKLAILSSAVYILKWKLAWFIHDVSLTCVPSAETRKINIFMSKSFKLCYWWDRRFGNNWSRGCTRSRLHRWLFN